MDLAETLASAQSSIGWTKRVAMVESNRLSIRTATATDADGILKCLHSAFQEFRSSYTTGAFLDTVLTPETIRKRLEASAQLLRTAESHLQQSDCGRVALDTTAPLRRAIRFYERNGFRPSGKVTDFFGMPLFEYVKTF